MGKKEKEKAAVDTNGGKGTTEEKETPIARRKKWHQGS